MKRERHDRHILEPVDLIVVVGAGATVIGALLMSLSSQGGFQIRPIPELDRAKAESSNLVQPVIGQIVTDMAVQERRSLDDTSRAAKRLQQAVVTDQIVQGATNERLRQVLGRAEREQIDKNARVEFVKGRSIVTFTSRVKKHNALPEDQWAAHNGRMINLAAKAGGKIEQEFHRAKDDRVREALAAEIESQTQAMRQSQERVGNAVVHLTMVEYHQGQVMEATQEQVGALLTAATRTEL